MHVYSYIGTLQSIIFALKITACENNETIGVN
jgi:hypothetical protein